jgi:hypothetical protein
MIPIRYVLVSLFTCVVCSPALASPHSNLIAQSRDSKKPEPSPRRDQPEAKPKAPAPKPKARKNRKSWYTVTFRIYPAMMSFTAISPKETDFPNAEPNESKQIPALFGGANTGFRIGKSLVLGIELNAVPSPGDLELKKGYEKETQRTDNLNIGPMFIFNFSRFHFDGSFGYSEWGFWDDREANTFFRSGNPDYAGYYSNMKFGMLLGKKSSFDLSIVYQHYVLPKEWQSQLGYSRNAQLYGVGIGFGKL